MMRPSPSHELRTLIVSFHPLIAIETAEEDRVRSILRQAATELSMGLFEWSVTRGLRRTERGGVLGACMLKTEQPLGALRHIEGLTVEGIYLLKDFAPFLKDPAVARQLRELAQHFTRTRSALVLTGSNVELPEETRHLCVYYDLALPGEDELRQVLEGVLCSLADGDRVTVDLLPEEQQQIVRALRGLTLNEARQAVAHAVLTDAKLGPGDVEGILDRKAQLLRDGGLLEYHPAADNPSRLAGFPRLKSWLERARMGFSPEARALGLRPPKGLLILGVQGCGKSLAARAIARSWTLPLVKLDFGRLYDAYIGNSERNLRKALAQAESLAPVVLWIDEIEKGLGGGTGPGRADGGVSRRIFGSLLTWLQEKSAEIFVVATANTVHELPPELLRKGRFDEIFFVDLPTPDERREIFCIHLELRDQDPARFDLDTLIQASDGFSGAEIEQATIAGLYRALHGRTALTTELLLAELRETRPLSVSRHEDLVRLREFARDRFVPVA
ncbi:MAG: AAA family ATPase [Myxococcota bacterium]